jgi:hypothetical protein
VLSSVTDVSGGEELTKSSPNTFHDGIYWDRWANIFETVWNQHMNNIIHPIQIHSNDESTHYMINRTAEKQFIDAIIKELLAPSDLNWSLSLARKQYVSCSTVIDNMNAGKLFNHFTIFNIINCLLRSFDD